MNNIINVNYEFNTLKVRATPMMLLYDILIKSVKHFRCDDKEKIEDYGLKSNSNNKLLDLSLPYRFSNLSQGANVELVKLNYTNNKSSFKNMTETDNIEENDSNLVNIRINILNDDNKSTSVTDKFKNSITIDDLIEYLRNHNYLKENLNTGLNIQIMMKLINSNDFNKKLNELGIIKGNYSIRIQVKGISKTERNKSPRNKSLNLNKNEEQFIEENESINNDDKASNIKHKKETEIRLISINHKDIIEREEYNEENEMSLEQAKVYQKILSNRVKNNYDKPLLTKKLREKIEKEEKEEKERKKGVKMDSQENFTIFRIKFPDNKIVQITMDNRKSLNDLIETINNQVLRKDLVKNQVNKYTIYYELFILHPFKKIIDDKISGNDLHKSIEKCEFGIKRVSLNFRINEKFKDLINYESINENGYILYKEIENRQIRLNAYNNGKTINENGDCEASMDLNAAGAEEVGDINYSAPQKRTFPSWLKLHK